MIIVIKIALIVSLTVFIRNVIVKLLIKRARSYFNIDETKTTWFLVKFFKKKNILQKILVFTIVFLISSLGGNSSFNSFIYAAIFIVLIIGYKKIREQAIKKEVLQDLLNICECLRVQLSSQISLETALKNLPELCKNKEFSEYITNIYLEYELYKFTINNSSKALEDRFNYSEIKMFVSALKQQNQHTSMLELIDNLIEILQEEYIEFLEDSTKSKMMIMTMGVFIIVVNIAAIGIYPVLVESFTAIDTIFK